MNDELTPELTSDPERINGFAPGDRVAIVNCELAGAYGKVEHSSRGCVPNICRDDCHIVWVELMSRPEGVEPHYSHTTYSRGPNVFRFLVSEVTHVD